MYQREQFYSCAFLSAVNSIHWLIERGWKCNIFHSRDLIERRSFRRKNPWICCDVRSAFCRNAILAGAGFSSFKWVEIEESSNFQIYTISSIFATTFRVNQLHLLRGVHFNSFSWAFRRHICDITTQRVIKAFWCRLTYSFLPTGEPKIAVGCGGGGAWVLDWGANLRFHGHHQNLLQLQIFATARRLFVDVSYLPRILINFFILFFFFGATTTKARCSWCHITWRETVGLELDWCFTSRSNNTTTTTSTSITIKTTTNY